MKIFKLSIILLFLLFPAFTYAVTPFSSLSFDSNFTVMNNADNTNTISLANNGSCTTGQYETADNQGSGPTCAQVQYSQIGSPPAIPTVTGGTCTNQYVSAISTSAVPTCTSWPTFNQSTTGTASNVSGTPALPNGTTATTQAQSDNSTKLNTSAWARLYTQPMYATFTTVSPGSTVTWTPAVGVNVYTLVPAQTETINMGTIPSGCVGQYITLVITTSGTNSYTLTFGTNIHYTASTLATGTTSAKKFVLFYLVESTTSVLEISRTVAE